MAVVYTIGALILRLIYLALPIVSAIVMVWSHHKDWRRHIAGAWVSGALVGGVVLIAFTFLIGGAVAWKQIALTLYLGVGLMLFLKVVDFALRVAIMKSLQRVKPTRGRVFAARAVRLTLFAAFTLPWVISALIVYRPRVVPGQTPATTLQLAYEQARFHASDGTRIVGWWMRSDHPSQTTAVLCPGIGGTKATFLTMIQKLHDANIGVLAIDMRGHGESGGQVSTFGAKESLDAIAAVDWLKNNHPQQAQRIIGVGSSTGAAALLSAAASDEQIDGVVCLSAFDTLNNELRAVAIDRLFTPVNWLVRAVGLPMASLHAGVDLSKVRPADAIGQVWPRPVLVINGTEDQVVPFSLGRALYDAAYEPREAMWVQGATHSGLLENADVIQRVIEFIRSATPRPVV